MDNFNIHKFFKDQYLAEAIINEGELDTLGHELAAAIEVNLDDKKEELKEIIKNNTFSGAGAKLRFAEWRKINA